MTVNTELEKQILDNLLYSKRHEIEINTCRIKQSWINNHLPPNSYNYLLNRFSDLFTTKDLPEILYRLYYQIENAPICKICHINKCKFLGFTKGYGKTCSYKCSINPDINKNILEIHNELNDNIILEKFLNNKEQLKSAYATKLYIQQHGYAEYLYNRFKDFDKSTDTIQELIYRIKNKTEEKPKCLICGKSVKFKNIKDGYRQYCSIECSRKSDLYYYNKRKTRSKSKELKWKELGFDIKFDPDNIDIYTIYNKCNLHNPFKIYARTFFNRWDDSNIVLCPICNPERNPETSIETKIKNILDKNNIKYKQHDRTTIYPKELDFYLTDYNIGIECNGIFWHNGNKGKNLTKLKYKLATDGNIQLLTFWEDDIHANINAIETIIKQKCNLIELNSNYKNLLTIKILDNDISNNFLLKYSLSKNINADINIGLLYNNTVLQILTFKLKNKKKQIYELYNYGINNDNSLNDNYKILFNYFISKFNWMEIVAYSNNELCNQDIFENLGFSFIRNIPQKFTYYNYKFSKRRQQLIDLIDDKNTLICYDAGKNYINF